MSAEHRRRYEEASAAVRDTYFAPLNAFADAARAWVEDAERRALHAEVVLEQLRPVWAQGYTDDSMAAQSLGNAVSELWELLYAKDQTQAMANLRRLIAMAGAAETHFREGFGAGMEYAHASEFPVSMADVPNEDVAWLEYQESLVT